MEVASRIPQKIFFTIGEVCELIKVAPHVLRYWETEFPMLTPQKNRAGQRVYRRKDVEMVMRIRDLLYDEKFTIAGAKKKLQDEIRGSSPRAKAMTKATPPIREERIASPATAPPQPADAVVLPGLKAAPLLDDQPTALQKRRALRMLKRDLEDLLTLLRSDASITG